MKTYFFCPTRFEVPAPFKNKTKVFGMGKEAAEALADELLKLPEDSRLVVFGCAGALREHFEPGEVFFVTHVGRFSLEPLANGKAARLASSEIILRTTAEKTAFQIQTHADLVDMEMDFLYQRLPDSVRKRVFFVRGVADRLNDEISFLGDHGILWTKLCSPRQLIHFLRFVYHFVIYLRGMKKVLEQIDPG
jgi:hypothetical protein